MKQTKAGSLLEAIINTLVGLAITLMALPVVNKICGISMTPSQMSWSTVLFTVISVARGYFIRRFFEGNIARYFLNRIGINANSPKH